MDNYSPYGHDCVKSSEILSAMEELFKHFSPFFFPHPSKKIKSMRAFLLFLFASSSKKVFPRTQDNHLTMY